MINWTLHSLRMQSGRVLPVLAALATFALSSISPLVADQPDPAGFVASMTAGDSVDDGVLPETVLAWMAGPSRDEVSADFLLPQVVWYPAMSAQTWSAGSQDPAVFNQASALGMVPVKDAVPAIEVLCPRLAQTAVKADTVVQVLKTSAEKPSTTVTPVRNPPKSGDKPAEPAAVSALQVAGKPAASTDKPATQAEKPAATTSKPASSAEKPAAAAPRKESSTQKVKDPVPSPASLHNKEISAKARDDARLAAVRILTETADPQLIPAPQLDGIPSPAQVVPTASKTVTGEQGSVVDITMDGHGWLYTGAPGTAVLATFIEKKTLQNSEVFRFRLAKDGLSSLSFKRQDLSAGFSDQVNVSLISMPRGGLPTKPASLPAASQNASLDAGRTTITPANDRNYPAVAPSFQAPAAQVVPAPLDLSAIPETGRLGYARDLVRAGNGADALRLLEPLAAEGGDTLDEALFLMAGIYQDDAAKRDLKKAFSLFVRIQKEFPRSQLAPKARDQALYLKRTFQVD